MQNKKLNAGLVIAALGVVYGDIGTSPLYALKESFNPEHGLALTESNVFGILSLIFWSILLIISLKYNLLILRADNNGEGGVLALTALISKHFKDNSKHLRFLTLLGLFGTALLYGDGMITPAISVLSAVEGLELIRPQLHPYIVPITVSILILLFSIQRKGTERIGKIFGPITLLWFIVLGTLGLIQALGSPQIFLALNPLYAYEFFVNNGFLGIVILGSVFLVVTGGEALYSDLGHFGRRPINFAWFLCVLPCLILNYLGQGALILKEPSAIKNPFFLLAPDWALFPLVILATLATVIASQALITGVFSITMQAVQLQYLPRTKIDHTSDKEFGQIYVNKMNWLLMICCIALVIFFGSSSALASAYGIAVTMTMLITTILFYFLARHSWKWSNYVALPLCGVIGGIELGYFGANSLKIAHGGWFPLIIGIAIFTVMSTWNKGREFLSKRILEKTTPNSDILARLIGQRIHRNPGVAIYMSGQSQFAPSTLALNLQHYSALHEVILIVTVKTEEIPYIDESCRSEVKNMTQGFYKILLRYGFMEVPDVPLALAKVRLKDDRPIPLDSASYFLGQEHLVTKRDGLGMALWRKKLFAYMSKNSQAASEFFNLPPEKVITVGLTIEI